MQDWQENRKRERRFGAYIEALVDAVGHADRREPLVGYLTGLMTVEGRKSVEPRMSYALAITWELAHEIPYEFYREFKLVA